MGKDAALLPVSHVNISTGILESGGETERDWRNNSADRALDVLPEVPSSGPSIHLRKLITTIAEAPQPMPFFWTPGTHNMQMQIYPYIHHKYNLKLKAL